MNRRHFLASSAAFAALSALPSCQKKGGSGSGGKLTIYTWSDYLDEKVKERFERENDCEIVIDTFDANEAMLAKLEAGASGYDIVMPSSYAVQSLKRKGLLLPLDHSKLPNLKNIDAAYLAKALDGKMEVSVPYLMATTCLAYLSSKVPDAKASWSLYDRTDLKGRCTLLDDMREVLGGALRTLGFSLNSTDPAELAKAADIAIGWKKNIAKFENEQYKDGIASGEFYLVQGYAGDLLQSVEANEDVRIAIPEEGAATSCDDFCIPKDAKNADLAHKFIDFMCGAERSAENMESLGYRAPNAAAYPHLSEDFRGSAVLFPPDSLFAKCEVIADLDDKLPLWTKEWDRVKNS